MPHRDDRDAARSRIEALERQLAEAEAEREEAEAELEQAEAARRALERRLASGEPHVARPPAEPAWSRDEFAKRIAALTPPASTWIPPAYQPPPAPRSGPTPPARPGVFAPPGQRPHSHAPGQRASRASAGLLVALTTLLVHVPCVALTSVPRAGVSDELVTAIAMLFVWSQALLNLVGLAALRARYPLRGFAGTLLTTVFSAFLLVMGGEAPPFPGNLGGAGIFLVASVALASYVVGGVATRPDDGHPDPQSAGEP